jgi:hypothetical protein
MAEIISMRQISAALFLAMTVLGGSAFAHTTAGAGDTCDRCSIGLVQASGSATVEASRVEYALAV